MISVENKLKEMELSKGENKPQNVAKYSLRSLEILKTVGTGIVSLLM